MTWHVPTREILQKCESKQCLDFHICDILNCFELSITFLGHPTFCYLLGGLILQSANSTVQTNMWVMYRMLKEIALNGNGKTIDSPLLFENIVLKQCLKVSNHENISRIQHSTVTQRNRSFPLLKIYYNEVINLKLSRQHLMLLSNYDNTTKNTTFNNEKTRR